MAHRGGQGRTRTSTAREMAPQWGPGTAARGTASRGSRGGGGGCCRGRAADRSPCCAGGRSLSTWRRRGTFRATSRRRSAACLRGAGRRRRASWPAGTERWCRPLSPRSSGHLAAAVDVGSQRGADTSEHGGEEVVAQIVPCRVQPVDERGEGGRSVVGDRVPQRGEDAV